MSRQMPGSFGLDQTPQTHNAGFSGASSSTGSGSAWSINLPPQYRKAMEDSLPYPDELDLTPGFLSMSDLQASRIVRHDFDNAANYRYQNHDWRWTIADTLYTGWKQPRFWDGTRIPRSSISVMVSFQQIESMLPRVMSALFGDKDWFESVPRSNTTPAAARAVRDIIISQLYPCNPREQLRQVVKSAIMYGNGILEVGWEYYSRTVSQFIPEFRPKHQTIWHPIDGRPISVPSGEFDRIVREFRMEEEINRPYIRYIPLKRFYIDPNAPGTIVNNARFTVIESYMDVDELDSLRNTAGFEGIPDRPYLLRLSKEKGYTQADMTASEQESSRRASYQPMIDQSTDPGAARLKVYVYRTKDRIIWMLNNSLLIFNKPNPLGRITQHNCFYADLLDRFYAMALSDVVEPEQRTQEGLLNSRMDELALAIHPQTVKQRGSGTPVYQVRVRPGGVSESQDPKNDMVRQYPMNATQNAHIESQSSQMRVQQTTGVTDLGAVGAGGSDNPALRTATGAGLSGQAASSRMQYFVENVESLVIEPAVMDVFEYDQRFMDPNQMIESVRGQQDIEDPGASKPLDPIVIWSSAVHFGVRASSRMQSRQALLSLMPMTLQAMLNPQLLQQLAGMGKTVDLVELMQMFMDASGYKDKATWIRTLTPQEQQSLNKPDPNQVKMDMQTQRMAALNDMQQNKQEMEMLRGLLLAKIQDQGNRAAILLKNQTSGGDGGAGGGTA